MMRRLRSSFTYANVVASLALFLALSGGAYAAATLAAGSVGTKQLKADAVTSPKIKDGQVGNADLSSKVRSKFGYTKSQSDGRYLPRAGTVSFTAPLTAWQATTSSYGVSSGAGFELLDNLASGGSLGVYRLGLTTPAEVQGQPVALQSVELCYSAFKPNTVLSRVSLLDATTTGSQSAATLTRPIDDTTVRDDTTCRTYTPPTLLTLDSSHTLTLEVRASFGAAGEWLVVNRVTATYTTG